jgi:hypothetical protein
MISTERETTAYIRFPIVIEYGADDGSDLTTLQVAATSDPEARPSAWATATLIPAEGNSLSRGTLDIVVLAGPVNGERNADLEHAGVGDYQLWTAIGTADEYIVERSAVWEVL